MQPKKYCNHILCNVGVHIFAVYGLTIPTHCKRITHAQSTCDFNYNNATKPMPSVAVVFSSGYALLCRRCTGNFTGHPNFDLTTSSHVHGTSLQAPDQK